jgi:hypothetical protein
MDDALLVRVLERCGDLHAQRQHVLHRKRPRLQFRRQRLPGNALHDQIVHAILLAYVVDGRDVWMAQLGQGASFFAEPAACGFIRQHAGGKYLDRDVTLQPLVAGAIHDPHAARAE